MSIGVCAQATRARNRSGTTRLRARRFIGVENRRTSDAFQRGDSSARRRRQEGGGEFIWQRLEDAVLYFTRENPLVGRGFAMRDAGEMGGVGAVVAPARDGCQRKEHREADHYKRNGFLHCCPLFAEMAVLLRKSHSNAPNNTATHGR